MLRHQLWRDAELLSPARRPLGLDLHDAFDSRDIVTKAAPRPLLGACHQSSTHRITVDVAQLLDAFGLAPDVEVVVTREPERSTLELAQLPSHVLLEHLHGDREFRPLRLGYEQVNVLGHDHISCDVESVPLACIFQSLFEDVPGAGSIQASLAVAATESDEVKTARFLKAFETPGHTGSSYAGLEDTGSGRGNNIVKCSGNRKRIGGQNPHPVAKNATRVGHPGVEILSRGQM